MIPRPLPGRTGGAGTASAAAAATVELAERINAVARADLPPAEETDRNGACRTPVGELSVRRLEVLLRTPPAGAQLRVELAGVEGGLLPVGAAVRAPRRHSCDAAGTRRLPRPDTWTSPLAVTSADRLVLLRPA